MMDRINEIIPSLPKTISVRQNTKHITQQKVAECMGVSQAMITRIENYHLSTLKINNIIRYIDAVKDLNNE